MGIMKTEVASYIDALKVHKRELVLFIETTFAKWEKKYKAKIDIPTEYYGTIQLFTDDDKLVGTYEIQDLSLKEINKTEKAKDVPQYWERDMRRIYFQFMKNTFKNWERKYIKEVNRKAKADVDYIKSI